MGGNLAHHWVRDYSLIPRHSARIIKGDRTGIVSYGLATGGVCDLDDSLVQASGSVAPDCKDKTFTAAIQNAKLHVGPSKNLHSETNSAAEGGVSYEAGIAGFWCPCRRKPDFSLLLFFTHKKSTQQRFWRRPVATNDTMEGRALNRRVELVKEQVCAVYKGTN